MCGKGYCRQGQLTRASFERKGLEGWSRQAPLRTKHGGTGRGTLFPYVQGLMRESITWPSMTPCELETRSPTMGLWTSDGQWLLTCLIWGHCAIIHRGALFRDNLGNRKNDIGISPPTGRGGIFGGDWLKRRGEPSAAIGSPPLFSQMTGLLPLSF